MKNKEKKVGFAGKLAGLFLKNKQLGFLSIAILLFWGVLSFFLMPKQYNPEIVAPAFNIVTEFPGANTDEVYQLITRPMENKLSELPKVDKIMSKSLDGGRSIVTVQFLIGEDIENAKISLMQKLESNMQFKPLGADRPQIKEINPDDVPILTIAFSSENYSPESLRKVAFEVGEKLKHIEGVSKLELRGGDKRQLTVSLNEDRLDVLEVSVGEVLNSLKENNQRVVAGEIENENARHKVVVDGSIRGVEELESIVIKKDQQKEILLSDLADVAFGKANEKSSARFLREGTSEDAVFLGIAKLKGSNATTVSNKILTELPTVTKSVVPEMVNWEVVRNDGRVAEESIGGLTKNLLTAIAIVSFVLLLFLGWKSAVVVAIAIPLTLAAVFGIGNLFDQTVNRITLFALILSLGLLVDNATVVVENVHRFLKGRNKKEKETLIVEAVDEVGAGLVMSTITTIFAFIPMAFITGMMGPYMGPIPFFIPTALVISLLIAFTVNPFLINFFLRKSSGNSRNQQNIFLKAMNALKLKYTQTLERVLKNKTKRRKILATVFLLLIILLSFPLFQVVKFRMLPKADREQFFVYLDLPAFTKFSVTNKISKDVENFIMEQFEVRSVQSFVGQPQIVDFNGLFKGSESRNGENQATLKVNLTHPDNRKDTSAQIVFALRKKLNAEFAKVPDLKIKLIEDPPGPPVLSTFLLKVQGENEQMVQEITKDLQEQVIKTEGVVDVDTSIVERTFEYALRVDAAKATKLGVSTEQIATNLRLILSDTNIGLFHQQSSDELQKGEQEYITLEFQDKAFDEKVDLSKLSIRNKDGQQVALSEIVTWERVGHSPVILSDNQKKTAYISAEMGNRSVTYGMIDVFRFLLSYKLTTGAGELRNFSLWDFDFIDTKTGDSFKVVLDGEWRLTLEVFRDLGIAMAIAIFLIYFVLVAQFGSLKIPLLIMGTIPLAMLGVMPGFAILGFSKGIYFNATSMIGVIALSGIVVNNAIIFLEYFNRLRKRDIESKEALLESGKTRLLPILLTSMTTVLGSLTIIGDPVWAGLSWAIIWGLSLSAFLTLFIFPILLIEFADIKD